VNIYAKEASKYFRNVRFIVLFFYLYNFDLLICFLKKLSNRIASERKCYHELNLRRIDYENNSVRDSLKFSVCAFRGRRERLRR